MTTLEKKNINRLYFEEKYSYAAIGKIYDISRQRVHQIITGYKSFASHHYSFATLPLKTSICIKCNTPSPTDIHHLDKDSQNNKPTNLAPLCKKCHKNIHQSKGKVATTNHKCLFCEEIFNRPLSYGGKKMFCSQRCSVRYRYARQ